MNLLQTVPLRVSVRYAHEFSHCLGLPDLYDTGYSGYYGMGSWDLMCDGSYNGDTFVPAGYTSYEKWYVVGSHQRN